MDNVKVYCHRLSVFRDNIFCREYERTLVVLFVKIQKTEQESALTFVKI